MSYLFYVAPVNGSYVEDANLLKELCLKWKTNYLAVESGSGFKLYSSSGSLQDVKKKNPDSRLFRADARGLEPV